MDERFQITMGDIERRMDFDGNTVYSAYGRFNFKQADPDKRGLISKDVTLKLLKDTYQEAVELDPILANGVSMAIREIEKIPGMLVENIPASIPGMPQDEYEQLLVNYRRMQIRSGSTMGEFSGKIRKLLDMCKKKGIAVVVDGPDGCIRFRFYQYGRGTSYIFQMDAWKFCDEETVARILMERIKELLMAPFIQELGEE